MRAVERRNRLSREVVEFSLEVLKTDRVHFWAACSDWLCSEQGGPFHLQPLGAAESAGLTERGLLSSMSSGTDTSKPENVFSIGTHVHKIFMYIICACIYTHIHCTWLAWGRKHSTHASTAQTAWSYSLLWLIRMNLLAVNNIYTLWIPLESIQ